MTRLRRMLAALLLVLAGCVGSVAVPAGALSGGGTPIAYRAPVTVTGLDLHDGQILQVGDTYYLYGTMYSCGFTWYTPHTPWCGFGVSTASSMSGPWSAPTLLFPANAADPYNAGHTYQDTCGATGQGCFSPRMIQRSGWGPSDGVWVLWFNAPWYYSSGAPHAYMAMGCNGPAGPCGATAGAPYGSTHRPTLHQCNGSNGDAGLTSADGTSPPALICPMAGNTSVAIEQLSYWGADGSGNGATGIAGLSGVEAMGAWKDSSSGTWVMTYSEGCGYCTGTAAGYATAPALLGPWTAPANTGAGSPVGGRRDWTANSCGGQADTVSLINGLPWQKFDLWRGTNNESGASLHFEPLYYQPATGTTGDGGLWRAGISAPFCN